MKKLSNQEVSEHLSRNLKDWTFDKGVIRRDFGFSNFVEAFSFMTSVALEAEKADHHPDWSNVYNKVTVALNTHSAGGITQLDLDLANRIDMIYKNFGRVL